MTIIIIVLLVLSLANLFGYYICFDRISATKQEIEFCKKEILFYSKAMPRAKTELAGIVTLRELTQYVIDNKPILRPVDTVVLAAEEESGNGNG